MQILPIVILHIICLPKFSFGKGCPDPATIGPRTDDVPSKSMCAMVFKDAENKPENSCIGESRMIYNTEETPDLGSNWDDTISSLVVRDGCTLEVFWDKNFRGPDKRYTGIYANLDHDHIGLGDWDNDISSYKCSCGFKPVDCVAMDTWVEIDSCSNAQAEGNLTCRYTSNHGISIGKGVSNDFDISGNIGKQLRLEFSMVFAEDDNVGISTGYNWSESKEFTIPEEKGKVVDYIAEPGKTMALNQIIGSCADTYIKTQEFKTRDE